MKRLTVLLSLLLVVCMVCAAAGQKSKTHKLTAEVVSVDTAAKTITVKTAAGQEMTAPVEGKALESLKDLKAGDKVTLTCRDNEQGQHEAIVEIQKAPAESSPTKPKT